MQYMLCCFGKNGKLFVNDKPCLHKQMCHNDFPAMGDGWKSVIVFSS